MPHPNIEFELNVALPEPTADPEAFLPMVFAHFGQDVLVGLGRSGHLGLAFAFQSERAFSDVLAEMAQAVVHAIPGSRVLEAHSELAVLSSTCHQFNARLSRVVDVSGVPHV